MTIIVIIDAQIKLCSSQSTLTKFKTELVNIIILQLRKFGYINPQGADAMLILRRSKVCEVN